MSATLLLLPAALASALDGAWARESDLGAVRAAQRASVDRALVEVPGVFHPVAERILAPTLKVCETYLIQLGADQLWVRCDAGVPIQSPLDGVIRTLEVAGEPRPVSVRRDGEGAALTIHSENGDRTTRYQPRPDGGMRVSVTLASTHTATEIGWTVDYARAP